MMQFVFIAVITYLGCTFAYPEQGLWYFTLDQNVHAKSVAKSLFKDSKLYVQMSCEGEPDQVLTITWSVSESRCWQNYDTYLTGQDIEDVGSTDNNTYKTTSRIPCSQHMVLEEIKKPVANREEDRLETTSGPDSSIEPDNQPHRLNGPVSAAKRPLYAIDQDGFYKVTIAIQDKKSFKVQVQIELMSKDSGYLSAADWPLLPFYGMMCLIYVVLGLAWLIVSFLQWRDLLRIQFWIGGVIFLGMLEMATYYAEYSSYNSTGSAERSVVLLAELVSCCKRTLARMLVIIVSLGFGIVKPRLGPMLHRVVGVGVLYFVFAATEAYLRVYRPKKDPTNQFLIATVPLALLDSAICWWIFISLSQTTRTLRLRRNLVKLSLYRHFTNILIFSVVASVIFMLYSIKAHHLTVCFEDWKELWMDDAYWRLLFSIILIVIMILWRPTNNNQKYAFSPLLDAPDDDDEDEEDQFVNDAYGVKMRGQSGGASSPKPSKSSVNTPDDNLKWVEENIPASLGDSALPILDTDEELMATRFELSKMQ